MSVPIPDDLRKILGPNEQAQLYIAQKIYRPKISIDSVLITNQRIILRHPHAMGLKKDYTDYNYQDVANVVLDKGFTRSTLKLVLRFGGEPLVLQDLPNSDAERAYALVRDDLGRYQAPFTQSAPYTASYQGPPVQAPPTGGGTIVEREVVKVRCRYCGTLNDETAKACVSCGAAL
ncbi:MAG: PH domain-containing protein [Nitrososphaerota archaeon]|nr:PH domain-containing protein [Nitrososphaerota archaeon]MDG7024134.1 PH domain-containing protein [Nitrososphaerota archaeon]